MRPDEGGREGGRAWKKGTFRYHATLCEKAHPLKALGFVASYLENRQFLKINDIPQLSPARLVFSPRGLFAITALLRGNCAGHNFRCSHTSNRLPSSRPGRVTGTSSLKTAPT